MRVFVTFFALLVLTSPAGAKPRSQPLSPPPLVRLQSPPSAQADENVPSWSYGAWKTYDMGDFTLASTINESGSAFGIACGKSCVWFVNFQTQCEVGKDYPAMVNSPAGSLAIQLRCYLLEKRWLLTFPVSDNSIDSIVKGGEIGFAIPLQSGKFGVSRFSLNDGTDATVKAVDIAIQKRGQNQEGLRDFTI